MNKRAFLVLGPESSGTRMMTEQLIAVGCYGDSDHVQRMDTAVPTDEPLIVWRRSAPHGNDHEWPDLEGAINRLWGKSYEVTAVVLSRDWHCMAISQEGQHTVDVGQALENIRKAYRDVFFTLEMTEIRYELVSYEALTTKPQSMRYLLRRLGLPEEPLIYFYDGNARYYEATAV